MSRSGKYYQSFVFLFSRKCIEPKSIKDKLEFLHSLAKGLDRLDVIISIIGDIFQKDSCTDQRQIHQMFDFFLRDAIGDRAFLQNVWW